MSASIPCDTCPYRRSTPVGVWDQAEYENLRSNDFDFGSMFGCHLGDKSLCRGWLADQKRRGIPSMTLRLKLFQSEKLQDVFEKVNDEDPDLYSSIEEMCAANEGQYFPKRNKKAQKLRRMKEKR